MMAVRVVRTPLPPPPSLSAPRALLARLAGLSLSPKRPLSHCGNWSFIQGLPFGRLVGVGSDARATLGVPRALREEVSAVLPGRELEGLLVVVTTQRSDLDLVNTGEAVDAEKDALLERFFVWAQAAAAALAAAGHWCDYVDPCSGLLMVDRSGHRSVYDEVSALAALRRYKTSNAGCCKIVLHPRWGSSVYPATLFTDAPPDALAGALQAAEAALQPPGPPT